MGSSKKPEQNVDDYYMSIHFGVCTGPVDEVTGIFVGEKLAWSGTKQSSGLIQVSKRNLFGGNKKEGGVEGSVFVLMGSDDQVLPDPVSSRFGLTPGDLPGFRGILSLFFTGPSLWDEVFPEVPPPGGGDPGEGG